jgi:hypothetical protein
MPAVSAGPRFLGIGAQRAGTTWLYANLSVQPGIWMPPVKELHYFDEKAVLRHAAFVWRVLGRSDPDQRWRRQLRDRGRVRRRAGRWPTKWEFRYFLGRPSDDWYLNLFEPGKGRISGEVTPSYMTLPAADVERVHQLLPEARIILLMRNPIERAWSGAVMELRDFPSAEAADRLPAVIEAASSRLRTDYLGALERWAAFYAADRIYVGFMEDLARWPQLLLSSICEFLGVGSASVFQRADRVVHRGTVSSMPAAVAGRLATMYAPLAREMARRFGGYADFWAFCTQRLQRGADESAAVPFPFAGTHLWEDWLAEGGEPPEVMQSGTLEQVGRLA